VAKRQIGKLGGHSGYNSTPSLIINLREIYQFET